MLKVVTCLASILIGSGAAHSALKMSIPQLLDECAMNLDRLGSWRLECDVFVQTGMDQHREPNQVMCFDLRFDGERIRIQGWKWVDDHETDRKSLDKTEADYLRFLWDGDTHRKYIKGGQEDAGIVYIDDFGAYESDTREYEINSLRYRHEAAFAMGRCPGTFGRIDEVLRQANSVFLRDGLEEVNGIPCYVIDSHTKHGDLTVWIDLKHGFSIAKCCIEAKGSAGHMQYGRTIPYETFRETFEIVRFQQVAGIWVGVEAMRHQLHTHERGRYVSDIRVRVTEFTLDPDHESLGSFEEDDVPNGTMVMVMPTTHIRYVWLDGELIKHIDEDVVDEIERILGGMVKMSEENDAPRDAEVTVEESIASVAADVNEPVTRVKPLNPPATRRAHCGLYCIYSFLKLSGLDPDFRELVVPEYFGRLRGSSLAELNQAARDYGFHAGVVARLSTKALRTSAYLTILHVKSDLESKDYDHYALFLGIERGKAKLFSPPEEPRLVDFAELAGLWDGYALFLSDRPFDADAIFGADRRRLVRYAVVGLVIIVVIHLARQLFLAIVGEVPRRRLLGLTVGEAVTFGLVALLCGGAYHFFHEEGLLANVRVTQAVQRARGGHVHPQNHREEDTPTARPRGYRSGRCQ